MYFEKSNAKVEDALKTSNLLRTINKLKAGISVLINDDLKLVD